MEYPDANHGVWNIYLHDWVIYRVNVRIYILYMEHMGYIESIHLFIHSRPKSIVDGFLWSRLGRKQLKGFPATHRISKFNRMHDIWVNYNDLTATEPWKYWWRREIIPFKGLNSGVSWRGRGLTKQQGTTALFQVSELLSFAQMCALEAGQSGLRGRIHQNSWTQQIEMNLPRMDICTDRNHRLA